MAEAEAGAGLAWRLLATLEGGSLLIATSALVAYTASKKLVKRRRHKTVNSVLVINSTTTLGQELKRKLEAHGCTVYTNTGGMQDKVDSLVIVGAESNPGLDGIAQLVSQDIQENLNLLESMSRAVTRGGCVAWVCGGDVTGAYGKATTAFDTVLRASLHHVAKIVQCDPIWVGRCSNTELAVERTIAELLPSMPCDNGFSFRNAAHKVGVFLSRWLKMVT